MLARKFVGDDEDELQRVRHLEAVRKRAQEILDEIGIEHKVTVEEAEAAIEADVGNPPSPVSPDVLRKMMFGAR